MGGRLEFEIRLLPPVLACTFAADEVVVLVDPSADPEAVRADVERLLAGAGVTLGVRLVGGAPEGPRGRTRRRRGILVGSAGASAALALVALVTGLRMQPPVRPSPGPDPGIGVVEPAEREGSRAVAIGSRPTAEQPRAGAAAPSQPSRPAPVVRAPPEVGGGGDVLPPAPDLPPPPAPGHDGIGGDEGGEGHCSRGIGPGHSSRGHGARGHDTVGHRHCA